MSVITLAADSTTVILNGRSYNALGEGDYVTLAPVNAATSHVNSAAGGVNINKRFDADVVDLTLRVQKYSTDDVELNTLRNSDTPKLISGSVKEAFSRDGSDFIESWALENGSITTQPTETKNNQDGNAMVEYVIRFRTGKRNL